ncbi:transglycosylase family protein [Streptomyces sp. NPDC007088]|uniref:transglycosylase family protein n=1 Tax=Streptomyces sp. NPDC007088 TaxID=3364773 RepID=UPI0036B6CF4B
MPLGRHRRYQPHPLQRASLTVTASGAGLALPLVAAGSAHAATEDTWRKVAACESGNDWDINTGNGFYGGLQFTQSTWKAYGGGAFADRADHASRTQQMAVAEKVLEGQGPGAWPQCGPRAGLARGGPGPGVHPDGAEKAKPVQQKHAQTARSKEVPDTRVKRTAQKTEPARGTHANPAATPQSRAGTARMYTVLHGDSLSGIAEEQRIAGGWEQLYAINRATVGADPDLILPGQHLSLAGSPGKTGPRHTPQKTAPHAAPRKAAPKAAPKKAEPAAGARKAEAKKAPEQTRQPKKADRATRTTTLTAPVAAGTGTQYRASGSSWSKGYHTGVDFPVATGTSVKAIGAGEVVSAGWGGSYGYQIVIRHHDGKYSQYAHLSALNVKAGQSVAAGQRIARSGATGNVTGPHLHFEVRTGPGFGSDVDPLAYLRAGGVHV